MWKISVVLILWLFSSIAFSKVQEQSQSQDQYQNVTMKLTYYVKNLDLSNGSGTLKASNNNGVLGGLVDGVVRTIVNLVLGLNGPIERELEPVSFDLGNYDLEMIQDVKISKVSFELLSQDGFFWNKPSLKFLKEMKVFASSEQVSNSSKSLLISYSSKNNKCDFKCIEFDIAPQASLGPFLREAKELSLVPFFKISSLPKKNTMLNGLIELDITLKLPY